MLLGSFQTAPVLAVIGILGVLLSAIYLLTLVQRVFYGPAKESDVHPFADLHWKERVVLWPLAMAIVVLGIFPQPWLQLFEPSARQSWQRLVAPAAPTVSQELQEQPAQGTGHG